MYGKGVANPSFRQRTAYHAMLLGGMAMITSALIVIGNKQTYADIELRHAEDIKRSLSQVIHPDMYTNDLLADVVRLPVANETKVVHVARSGKKVVAVAFEMVTEGYSGPITVIIGINRKGELLGARVLSHTETPGLGDKIEAEKSDWIFSFGGLSLASLGESKWKVKKDGGYFDQFTGATITPRAVVKAIKSGLEIFKANQAILLAENQPQKPEPAGETGVHKSLPSTEPMPDVNPSPDKKDVNTGKLQTKTSINVTDRGKTSG
jgi:electron transport complex protein RnfG